MFNLLKVNLSHEGQVKVKSSLLPLLVKHQVLGFQICDSILMQIKSCDLSLPSLLPHHLFGFHLCFFILLYVALEKPVLLWIKWIN